MAKIIYEVTRRHHERHYRKGDLESRDVQDFSETFATRKAANECLEKHAKIANHTPGWTSRIKLVKRGDEPSLLFVYTGDKWINENSGEEEVEVYAYYVTKKTL